MPNTNEQKFFNPLRDIFVGARIEGESGSPLQDKRNNEKHSLVFEICKKFYNLLLVLIKTKSSGFLVITRYT